MLLNDAGLPQGDSKIQKIGDQQATCLVGWTNTFSYKNFTLSFLVDARIGGEIFFWFKPNVASQWCGSMYCGKR